MSERNMSEMRSNWRYKRLGFIEMRVLQSAMAVFALLSIGASPASLFGQGSDTPSTITPPAGNVLFLKAHAKGTQNYICEPSTNGNDNTWVFFSPQATLSISILERLDQQVVTHFLSPVPNAKSNVAAGCTFSGETGETSC